MAAGCYQASRSRCVAVVPNPQLKLHKKRKTTWPRSPKQNIRGKKFLKNQIPLWQSFMKVN